MTPFVDAADAQVVQVIDKSALPVAYGSAAGRRRPRVIHHCVGAGRQKRYRPGRTAALSSVADQPTSSEHSLAWAQIVLQSALKPEPQAINYWRQVKNSTSIVGRCT